MEAEEQTSKFKLKLGLIDVHLNLKDETEAKIAERSQLIKAYEQRLMDAKQKMVKIYTDLHE